MPTKKLIDRILSSLPAGEYAKLIFKVLNQEEKEKLLKDTLSEEELRRLKKIETQKKMALLSR